MLRTTRIGRTGNSKTRTFGSRKTGMTDKFIDDQIDFVWSIYLRLLKRGSVTLSKKEHGHHLFLLAGSLYPSNYLNALPTGWLKN